MRTRVVGWMWAVLTGIASTVQAGVPPLPQHDGQQRAGVATCAQSRCHDAAKPWQTSKILQNEFRTWIEYSTHAESFRVLSGPEGRRIGELLGIDPATSSQCLNCHADQVPVAQRGADFRLEDGVGCEACHGGSGPWLENHVSMSGSRDEYLAAGLYPTEFPEPRAHLCLGCHLGTKDKFVDHRLLAAGHPRLVFEQDTFFFNMPLHHRDDEDYRFRKSPPPNAQFWIVGQLVAAQRYLELIDDDRLRQNGIWLEPAFQDCYACHTMYRHGQGSPQGRSPLRLNLAGLHMVEVIWNDPSLAANVRAVDRATSADLATLRQSVRRLQAQLANIAGQERVFSTADCRLIFSELIARAATGRYATYLEAEQATMGIAALARTIDPEGRLGGAIDGLFAATADDQTFRSSGFTAAAASLRRAVQQPE